MRTPSLKRMIGAQKAKLTRASKRALPLYGEGIYTKPSKKIYNKAYKKITFSLINVLFGKRRK